MHHIHKVVLFTLITAGCTNSDSSSHPVNTLDIADASDVTDATDPNSEDAGVTDTSGAAGTGDAAKANPHNNRVTDGLIALYEFEEGAGTTVHDEVDPTYDLTIQNPARVTWLDHALRIDTFTTIVSNSMTFDKVVTACQATSEASIEVWVAPAMVNQDNFGRIVAMSEPDGGKQNFAFGTSNDSTNWAWSFYLNRFIYGARTQVTTSLTHVVATGGSDGITLLFVNAKRAITPYLASAEISNWKGLPLTVGNVLDGSQGWKGEIHLIAIYCRVLTDAEVAQNFAAGADP